MPITDFRPKPGRFGTQPTFLNTPLTTVAAAAAPTARLDYLGAPPTKSIFSKATVSAFTLPAGATTLTAKIVKRRAGANTDLTLATAIQAGSVGAATLTNVTTLTDVDKTILPTDTLHIVVDGTGSVTTASIGLFANVELLVSE